MAAGSFMGGLSAQVMGPRVPYFLAVSVIVLLAAVQIRLFRRRKPASKA